MGWEPMKSGKTMVCWVFARSGVSIGFVGMPRHNNGKYSARLYYDACGHRLQFNREIGRYATRAAAMRAVEDHYWTVPQ